MNMQQLIIQAQKVQREMNKALDALKEKEFTISKNGAVTVVLKGDKTIKSLDIDKDALDPSNKEMIEELIALAINEGVAQIEKESDEIQSKVAGSNGGLF